MTARRLPHPQEPPATTLTPATATLAALGSTVQLAAEVRDQNARVMGGVAVTCTSSAGAVATVDASGLVAGVAEGVAMITASAGSARGSASRRLTPPGPGRS